MAESDRAATSGRWAVILTRVAGLWILAGALFKLLLGTPADLPRLVRDLPVDLGLLFRVAIAAELSVAILALLRPRSAWLLVMVLFVLFDVALVTQILAGEESCGCFGSEVTIPPAAMLGIDTFLLLLLLLARPWAGSSRDLVALPLVLVVLAAAIPLPWVLDREAEGPGSTRPGGAWTLLEVRGWEGRKFAETDLAKWVDVSKYPPDAVWILWRLDCEDCAELFETIAPIEWGIRPLVLVELPVPAEKLQGPPHVKALPEGDHVHRVRLPEGTEFLGTTPMVLVVHEGCVIFARDGMKAAEWGETQSPEIPEGCR